MRNKTILMQLRAYGIGCRQLLRLDPWANLERPMKSPAAFIRVQTAAQSDVTRLTSTLTNLQGFENITRLVPL